MRFVTFGLALLSAGGVVSLVLLATAGEWRTISLGGLTIGVGLLIAAASQAAGEALGRRTGVVLRRGAEGALRPGPAAARAEALLSGTVPMAAMIAYQLAAFRLLPHQTFLPWWLAYTVATWPWTLLALAAPASIGTLRGVRAYTGQVMCLGLTIAMNCLGASGWVTTAVLAIVAAPAAIVGTLAAMTDPALLPGMPRAQLARLPACQ